MFLKIAQYSLITGVLAVSVGCQHQQPITSHTEAPSTTNVSASFPITTETSITEDNLDTPAVEVSPASPQITDATSQKPSEFGVALAAPQPAQIVAQERNAHINLRAQPTTYSESLGYGIAGDTISVLRSSRSEDDNYVWYYVQLNKSGTEGWMRAQFVATELASSNSSESGQPRSSGTEIVAVEAGCVESLPGNEICESHLEVVLQNSTSIAQQYVVLAVDLFDEQGERLNFECLTGVDLIELKQPLSPGEQITVTTHGRKYFKYSAATITDIDWMGLEKPDYADIIPGWASRNCP